MCWWVAKLSRKKVWTSLFWNPQRSCKDQVTSERQYCRAARGRSAKSLVIQTIEFNFGNLRSPTYLGLEHRIAHNVGARLFDFIVRRCWRLDVKVWFKFRWNTDRLAILCPSKYTNDVLFVNVTSLRDQVDERQRVIKRFQLVARRATRLTSHVRAWNTTILSFFVEQCPKSLSVCVQLTAT